MSDLTYTTQGSFDSNRNAILNICIPAERIPGDYITEMYNFSKKTAGGVVNAIFCHFSNHSTEPIQHNSFDYRLEFNLDTLNSYPGTEDFDERKEDAVFIFFHNNSFDETDRAYYFNEIENIYDQLKLTGNQSQMSFKTNAVLSNPRKVGMSLIKKN